MFIYQNQKQISSKQNLLKTTILKNQSIKHYLSQKEIKSKQKSQRRQPKHFVIDLMFNINMLSGKSALWKNIGKEDTIKQYQSSISSSNKPVKAFHIMFQDDNPSKSDGQSSSQLKKHEEGLLYYDNPNISMRGQQDNEGSPMIITVDNGYNKQQNEQVLEVISFDSQYQNGNHQMNQILASFTEFQENSHKTKRKSFASFQLPAINRNDGKQREFQTSKFFAVLQNIRDLKDHIYLHKKQSQNAIQKCRSQFINYLLNMKQALIARQKNISSTQTLSKPDQLKYSEQVNIKYSTLQQQVQNLNQTLSFERQAREVARRQKRDIQQKLRKVERTQKQQRNRLGSEQAIIDDLKVRINRLQIQLKQARLQCQNNTARVPKLKQVIKERQLLINSRNNQVVELQKKVKYMAISLEDKNSKQHRLELQLKGLKERLQKQSSESNKEVSKYKGQISKLKTLLKTSEQQLSNCEEYINRLNFELKEQQSQNQKMRQKTKQTEILFHKKLQQYESYLAQLQNNISQMSLAQQQKQQELSNKQDELYRIRQEFQNKILEVKGKQDELQQIKKQIDFKMMSLERKEDGLKAEYKMVLQNQNAVKDKWYERYYAMFSPERQKRYQSPPIYSPAQRDVNPLSGRSSFNRKDQIDLQELEVRSSNRQKLYKVKSQKNICINPSTSNFYRSDVIKTSRNDRDLTSSPAQLTGLGSRINNLRRELTRELGQISQH